MICSYCGHAGAGVRLLPTAAFVCGKALCQNLGLHENLIPQATVTKAARADRSLDGD